MGKVLFMNARVYLNTFKCYSDCHLKWVVSLKKRNNVLKLIGKKRICNDNSREGANCVG